MKKWSFYTAKEIRPEGWLRRQLEIEAEGLTGNLDKVWPDVRDSAWIGGSREGWERVPYWLDGFVPLAYLLENEDMIQRAKKYIDAILSSQRESGWICPCAEEEIPEYQPSRFTPRPQDVRYEYPATPAPTEQGYTDGVRMHTPASPA